MLHLPLAAYWREEIVRSGANPALTKDKVGPNVGLSCLIAMAMSAVGTATTSATESGVVVVAGQRKQAPDFPSP